MLILIVSINECNWFEYRHIRTLLDIEMKKSPVVDPGFRRKKKGGGGIGGALMGNFKNNGFWAEFYIENMLNLG